MRGSDFSDFGATSGMMVLVAALAWTGAAGDEADAEEMVALEQDVAAGFGFEPKRKPFFMPPKAAGVDAV